MTDEVLEQLREWVDAKPSHSCSIHRARGAWWAELRWVDTLNRRVLEGGQTVTEAITKALARRPATAE